MCQCRYMNCNKYTSLVKDAGSRGGCEEGGRGIDKNSVFSAHFCCYSKSVLKNMVCAKK